MDSVETKACRDCQTEKPVAEFYSQKGRKDGLGTACRVCVIARVTDNRRNRDPNKPKTWLVVDGKKLCTRCGETKPVEQFTKRGDRKDVYTSHCRSCINAYVRERRAKQTPVVQIDSSVLRCCPGCKVTKPLSEFGKNSKRPNGAMVRCKLCMRKHYAGRDKRVVRGELIKRKYGITIEQYEAMVNEQGGKCAICGTSIIGARRAHVDHSHDTGEVRAVLCPGCNTGLAQFRESREVMLSAIAYLDLHSKVNCQTSTILPAV